MALQRTRFIDAVRRRAVPLGVGVLLATVAVGTLCSVWSEPTQHALISPTDTAPSSSTQVLYVHVAGAVLHPGVVRLPPGARVFDAIAAAGGVRSDGDSDGLNLARELRSGEQIMVPMRGQTGGPAAATLINLNTADAAALESLPHVGPALAQRIISYRGEHGGFQSIDELSQIPGLGPKRLDEIRPLVCL